MTHTCLTQILGRKPSKTWLEKTLSKRLKALQRETSPDNEGSGLSTLHKLLIAASEASDFRNRIAHGAFVIDTTIAMTHDEDDQLVLYALGHQDTITEQAIREKASEFRALSNRLARELAVLKMSQT